jgi:hypothetical protein
MVLHIAPTELRVFAGCFSTNITLPLELKSSGFNKQSLKASVKGELSLPLELKGSFEGD